MITIEEHNTWAIDRDRRCTYRVQSDGGRSLFDLNQETRNNNKTNAFSNISTYISSIFQNTFLPVGYPNSVPRDYLSYQFWDSIQGLSSYVRGMLSSQALLSGIGVGSATAAPASAVIQLVFRDAVGLLGSLIFTALEGSSFDSHAKQWRITADIANDIALTLELISTYFPPVFLLLVSISSACRAIVGVAGAASRTSLTYHFAQHNTAINNAADITAKEGSQETAVTLIGMLLGVVLVKISNIMPLFGVAMFILLTYIHIIANIYALRCLCIAQLNPPRLDVLLEDYYLNHATAIKNTKKVVLTPQQVGTRESLMPPPLQRILLNTLLYFGKRNKEHYKTIIVAPPLKNMAVEKRKYIIDQIESKYENVEDNDDFVVVMMPPKTAYVFLIDNRDAVGTDTSTVPSPCASTLLIKGYCTAWLSIMQNNGVLIMNGDTTTLSKSVDEFMGKLELAGWSLQKPSLMQSDSRIKIHMVATDDGHLQLEDENSKKKKII